MKKNILIILSSIGFIIVIFGISALLFFEFFGNNFNSIKTDVKSSLNFILYQKDDEPYVLNMDSSLKTINNNKTAKNILSSIKYNNISIKEINNNIAKIELSFTYPDISEIIKKNTTSKNPQEDILSIINKKIDNKKFKTKTTTIQINLKKLNDHWYLIPNNDLSNVLSGNTLSVYQKHITNLQKEWEDIK